METESKSLSETQLCTKLDTTQVCAICIEDVIEPEWLECAHVFCGKCIHEWIKYKKECPTCRLKINVYQEDCKHRYQNFYSSEHTRVDFMSGLLGIAADLSFELLKKTIRIQVRSNLRPLPQTIKVTPNLGAGNSVKFNGIYQYID